MLSGPELERFARHIMLAEIGGPGQEKLRSAKVLVVGAGGLGSPLLMYLAAAGVGLIGIVDHDRVTLSNLHRQIIHTTAQLGTLKVTSAKKMLHAINPGTAIIEHNAKLDSENVMELMGSYDIIADGSDNFPTRFLISDAAFLAQKTLVSASVVQFDGQISTFKPFEKDKNGVSYPTYRCFVGDLPPADLIQSCEEMGILGALPGVLGSMQALEIIKELVGIGVSLAGRMVLYDSLAARFFEMKLAWNPNNPLNGINPEITKIEAWRYQVSGWGLPQSEPSDKEN